MSVQAIVDRAKRVLGRLAGGGAEGTTLESDVLAVEALPPREALPAPTDVIERAGETVLVLDVPGATRRTTDIAVAGGQLDVIARRVDTRDPEALDWRRRFELSEVVDTSAIRADLSQGVLTIHLPMKASASRRRIRIGRPLLSS
jgi:HSP20 family protein